MDYEQARFNMIEQQVRTWDVLEQRVLDTLSTIHREDFVPEPYKRLALADINIPLANGQVTLQPKIEARLIQTLNITDRDKILEVGTGCAYLTAILSRFGKEVISIDMFPEFASEGEIKLNRYNINNVSLITENAIDGWSAQAPYDVIVISGSLPMANREIEQQLNLGGRLFVIVGQSPVMDATLVTRISEDQWTRESLFETDIPALIGAKEISKFKF